MDSPPVTSDLPLGLGGLKQVLQGARSRHNLEVEPGQKSLTLKRRPEETEKTTPVTGPARAPISFLVIARNSPDSSSKLVGHQDL